MNKPTEKQIAFATEISETLGSDLPEETTKSAYGKYIEENVREYYKVKAQVKRMIEL